MLHFHSFEEVELANAWATIGAFDGVHAGHQVILAPLIQEAHAAGSPAVVVTFYPHPMVVLRGIDEPFYLTSPEERAYLLGELGIDAVVTLTFDLQLAAQSAQEFMQNMQRHLGLRQLWVGNDFALGRHRQGDLPTLERLGQKMGYHLHITPEVTVSGERVSSSQIRALLKEGQAAKAARMLGRPYAIEGAVVHGDGRGRGLGIPTANLDFWPEKIIPAHGVYATWAWVQNHTERVPAVTNVGVRPTFEGHATRIEAHLLDYDQDLYDQSVRLEFLEYIRPEKRFDSVEALLEQINADTQRAREVFTNAA